MSAQSPLRSGLSLAIIAAICTGLIALTYALTGQRIEHNRNAYLESSLAPALSGLVYDGNITGHALTLEPPHELPGNDAAIIYRVFRDGAPAAALFAVTARDGYSGPIRLLVGIDVDGRVTGVRILEHRETPGLGDAIENERSDWAEQFPGRSAGDPPLEDWRIRADGGVFDQLTGASVTPRAVLAALRQTLRYFEDHRDTLFAGVESE